MSSNKIGPKEMALRAQRESKRRKPKVRSVAEATIADFQKAVRAANDERKRKKAKGAVVTTIPIAASEADAAIALREMTEASRMAMPSKVDDDGGVPDFLKRTETAAEAAAREAKQQKPDKSAGVTLAPDLPPLDVRKAIAKDLGDDADLATETETKPMEATVTKLKTKKSKKAKTANGSGKKTKVQIVADLLTRKEGCTTADVLKATGWPSVSMPAQAKAAGLRLKKEKDGSVIRYRAS